MARNRNLTELMRDAGKSGVAPSANVVLAASFRGAVEKPIVTPKSYPSNVTTIPSLAPKNVEPFKVPKSAIEGWARMLGIDGAELTEGDIEIVWLRPSEIVANIASIKNPGEGYQRNPRERMAKLKEIAENFDPRLLGLFHTWPNAAGQDEALDALGRCFVCLNLLTPVYDFPVLVWRHKHVKNVKEAAKWFRLLNPDTATKVNRKNKFLSRLTEREPLAMNVQDAADKGALTVGGTGRRGISPQAAEACYQMEKLTEVGVLTTNCGWTEKLGNPEYIGLAGYLVATGDNSTKLRSVLRESGPELVRAKMHEMYGASKPHARISAARFARAVFSLRNEGLRSNAIKAKWAVVDAIMGMPPFNDRWGKPVVEDAAED